VWLDEWKAGMAVPSRGVEGIYPDRSVRLGLPFFYCKVLGLQDKRTGLVFSLVRLGVGLDLHALLPSAVTRSYVNSSSQRNL